MELTMRSVGWLALAAIEGSAEIVKCGSCGRDALA